MKRRSSSSSGGPKDQGLLPFRRTVIAAQAVAVPYYDVARVARSHLPGLVTEALPARKHTPYDSVAVVSLRRLLRHFIRIPVDVEVKTPDRRGGGVIAHVHWRAHRWGWLFPVMEADLVARPCIENRSELVLVGTYHPPFGILGVLGDVLLGRSVARSTADAFIGELGRALEHAVSNDEMSTPLFPATKEAA